MADQQNNCQLYHKISHVDGSGIINATEVDEKTLTNIYYDCLERIFDFLDLETLLNVAGTCKRLQIAAIAYFGEQYGGKLIRLACHSFDSYQRRPISITGDNVHIHGLEFCFPFLRCFGAKFSKMLVLSYSETVDSLNEHLDRYINQYCADTLTSIEFLYRENFSAENFPKPFRNVSEVRVKGAQRHRIAKVRKHLNHFVEWFPNLRRLQLYTVLLDDTDIGISFPHLEHLSLELVINNTKEMILFEKLLRANRQLQSLDIDLRGSELRTLVGLDKVLNIISGNPFIQILKVKQLPNWHVSIVELNRLIDEYPSIKILHLIGFQFSADDVIMCIRQLNSLTQFSFTNMNRFESDRLQNLLDKKWTVNISTARFREYYANYDLFELLKT